MERLRPMSLQPCQLTILQSYFSMTSKSTMLDIMLFLQGLDEGPEGDCSQFNTLPFTQVRPGWSGRLPAIDIYAVCAGC